MNKAYINAISIKSICGDTKETFEAILNGRSHLSLDDSIISDKTVCIGKIHADETFDELLYQSLDEILISSNLDNFTDTLLLVGSSVGGMSLTEKTLLRDGKINNINIKRHVINSIASTLNKKYHFLAHRSFSTACTSSANALKTAKELINCGAYKNILVVGADELCLTTLFGFNSLGILSDKICTPFKSGRKGMNVSEGIGVLLLQDRYQQNSIQFVGAGASSDAYHIANPNPDASGFMLSIKRALDDASLDASMVEYINAHGTGTQANDATEAKAIRTIFDDNIYVSSSKPNIGHTLGASGAIEAIICIKALQEQILPPQLSCDNIDEMVNIVQKPISMKINYVLSNSFAFGGNNVSLLFGVCCEN